MTASAGEDGFSLIELLIVVVILGVLASIAVIAIANVADDGNKNACAAEAHSFTTAVQAYKAGAQHLNVLPPGNTVDDVAKTLFQAGLLSKDHVTYGADGAPSAHHWGFVAATDVVTPDNATCAS